MSIVVHGLLIGVIATLCLDVWAIFVKKILHLPAAHWAMVGRWVGHLPRGRFVHPAIAESPPISHELAIGWITHYVTGIVYGVAYLGIVQGLLARDPSLVSALVFGIATVVAPWFILQPGLGAGVFASRTPNPARTRMINLSMHTVFGLSLYVGWLIVMQLLH